MKGGTPYSERLQSFDDVFSLDGAGPPSEFRRENRQPRATWGRNRRALSHSYPALLTNRRRLFIRPSVHRRREVTFQSSPQSAGILAAPSIVDSGFGGDWVPRATRTPSPTCLGPGGPWLRPRRPFSSHFSPLRGSFWFPPSTHSANSCSTLMISSTS